MCLVLRKIQQHPVREKSLLLVAFHTQVGRSETQTRAGAHITDHIMSGCVGGFDTVAISFARLFLESLFRSESICT